MKAFKRFIGTFLAVLMVVALYQPIGSVKAEGFTAEIKVDGGWTTVKDLDYGASFTLEVVVNGADANSVTYQWKSAVDQGQWTDINGATGREYRVEHADRSYYYKCDVTNGSKSTTSNTAYIGVAAPFSLSVVGEQTRIEVNKGSTANLGVTATEGFNLTYSWEKDGTVIDGANSNSYTTEAINNNHQYSVTATDAEGHSASVSFDVVVDNELSVSTDCTNEDNKYWVKKGQDLTVNIIASANETDGMRYSWTQYDSFGSYGIPNKWHSITDANGSSYTFRNITGKTGGYCNVTDKFGNSVPTSFIINIDNELRVSADERGNSTKNIETECGKTVTLDPVVTAIETDEMTYKWYSGTYNSTSRQWDWSVINGATESSYRFEAIRDGGFQCEVTDKYGTVGKAVFSIKAKKPEFVVTAGDMTKQGFTCTVYAKTDENAFLKVNVVEGTASSYVWQRVVSDGNGGYRVVNLGLGEDTYAVSYDGTNQSGNYRCLIYDRYGSYDWAFFRVVFEEANSNEESNGKPEVKEVQEEDIAEAVPGAGVGTRETVQTSRGSIEIVKRAGTSVEEVAASENLEKEVKDAVSDIVRDEEKKVSIEKVLEIDITTWFEDIAGGVFEDDNHKAGTITETSEGKKITIQFRLDNYDENLVYRVVRYHTEADGSQTKTVLDTEYLGDNWFSFESDKFSTFAVVSLAPVTEDNSVKTVVMYRLYNPNSGEHFYTGSKRETKNLKDAGWEYEGIAWEGPEKSNTPVYRLYNENVGEHHYTTSKRERDKLIEIGWKDEGIGWYSDDSKTKPLYRLYNPNATIGSHHYTTSTRERDKLVKIGWNDEGIGWYGYAQ